jgi:serine/threonine protein kinase
MELTVQMAAKVYDFFQPRCDTSAMYNSATDFGESIGSGAYGQVYKCTRESDGQTVALKRFYSNIGNPLNVLDVLHEYAIRMVLGDTCRRGMFVCPTAVFYDPDFNAGDESVRPEDRGALFLEMPFVDNASPLSDTLKAWYGRHNSTQVPLAILLELMGTILHAVDMLHDLGVYHNDLHGQNIMVSENLQTICLLDFGLACSVRDRRIRVCMSLADTSDVEALKTLIKDSHKNAYRVVPLPDVLKVCKTVKDLITRWYEPALQQAQPPDAKRVRPAGDE